LAANQFRCQRRQTLDLIVGPTIFDGHVLAFDEACVFQALAKCTHAVRVAVGVCGVEEPDHRHRQLLRACREGPSSCAAEERDELAPPHELPSNEAHNLAHHWTISAPVHRSKIFPLISA
jgi:hypothetical protein